jgi:hypothetical protein
MRTAPVLVVLLGLLGHSASHAQAAPGMEPPAREPWEIPPAPEAATRSYRPVLIATYVLAPIVASSVAFQTESPYALLAVFPGPSIVHAANGKASHALLAPLAMAGSMVGGGLLFGAPALLVNDCETTFDDLGCGYTPVLAASIGALIGYGVWAVIDILDNGERR